VIDSDGRITAAGHAKKGAATAQQILYRSGNTPFSIREAIVGLVRHHGLPIWIFEKPNPQQMLLKASFEVNTAWVYLLAKADMLGRVCQDQADMLYRIELFKELCIENDCWGKPKVFASELSKFSYFRKEEQAIDYEVFDNTKAEAVLLVGVAGAGKDTYCNKYFKDHAVVSLDALRREQNVTYGDSVGNGRIIQEGKELAKSYLRQQISFVWNATNLTRQMRESLIDLFASYGAKVKIVYIEAPYRQLIAQNKNRQYAIPSNAVERMIDKLEVPKLWEAVSVLYVV
jgi:predicted kinase